jgi:hypothetical protein
MLALAALLAVAAAPPPTPSLSPADRRTLQAYGCRSNDATLLVQCALGTLRVRCRALERELLSAPPATAQAALAKARACIAHADGFSDRSSWKAAHESLLQAEGPRRPLGSGARRQGAPAPERFDPQGPPAQRLAEMKAFCARQSAALGTLAKAPPAAKLGPRERLLFNADLALGRGAAAECDAAVSRGWASATSMATELAGAVTAASQLLYMFRLPCPSEMAFIYDHDHWFCIDRWEATIVEKTSGQALSPYFTPSKAPSGWISARGQFERWNDKKFQTPKVAMPLMQPWELQGLYEPKAVSRPGVDPQGFMTRTLAAKACENAGKRLCKRAEWYKACVGPGVTTTAGSFPVAFPYGPRYVAGKCNYYTAAGWHPLTILGRGSTQLDDPRLMLVENGGKRLLQKTGALADCTNGYGVFDMVGNQDEIVDEVVRRNDPTDPVHMTFVGSFYSRGDVGGGSGCGAAITAHSSVGHLDYSVGFRCCSNVWSAP